VAIPAALIILPVALMALAGGKRGGRVGGAPPAIGPWGEGDKPWPIWEGREDNPETAALLQEMDDYFASYGGIDLNLIDAREVTLLRKWGRHAIPPREYWPRMAATIRYGFMPIRRALKGEIIITSAYRPPDYNEKVKGKPGSRHQWFEALDMVAPTGMANQQALLAARMWLEYGEKMRMGLGVYGSPGSATNIHIDTGSNQRTWREADYWIERVQLAA
jgi:hypothetical protein